MPESIRGRGMGRREAMLVIVCKTFSNEVPQATEREVYV